MKGNRDENRTWEVEVLPTGQGERRGPPPVGSRVLGTVMLIGAIAAGLAMLALLVVFAATVALISMPVALGAALIVWAGTKLRDHTARRGR